MKKKAAALVMTVILALSAGLVLAGCGNSSNLTETAKLIKCDSIRYNNIIATTPRGEAVLMLDCETFEMIAYRGGESEYRFPVP